MHNEQLPDKIKRDHQLDRALRPENLTNFHGQDALVERLSVFLRASMERDEVPGHCLFFGPPGLGKTSLAHAIAHYLDVPLVCVIGPQITKPADITGVLASMAHGTVLFVDEIHRINRSVEEYLYSAMEDYKLYFTNSAGLASTPVEISIPHFTLIGATTQAGMITAPLRSRFSFVGKLNYYDDESLVSVLSRSARLLNVCADHDALLEIARRSRGTPRVANHLLRWARDYAQVYGEETLNRNVAKKALAMLLIDDWGLNELDVKLLSTLIDQYQGGPVGMKSLAVAIGEDVGTLEEVCEPFLISKGLLKKTTRGRMVTKLAYQHLKKKQKHECEESSL